WNPVRPGLSASVLVPARALLDTARSLTSGAEVLIALGLPGEGGQAGDGMIGFEGGGRRTTTRLLGGEFPPYRALLPGNPTVVGELATRRRPPRCLTGAMSSTATRTVTSPTPVASGPRASRPRSTRSTCSTAWPPSTPTPPGSRSPGRARPC